MKLLLILFSITFIQLFTSVSQQLYKFLAIVMEAFKLYVCEVVIAVK